MLSYKDKIKPTQPYFVLDTVDFWQEIYLLQGISHFYTFKTEEGTLSRTVPDGCIDLVMEFSDSTMNGYVCGTRLGYHTEPWDSVREVFGVRFMPGMHPEMLNVSMKDVLEKKIPLKDAASGDDSWIDRISAESDFYQRIRVFIEYYTKCEKKRVKPFGKQEIVASVKNMVYSSLGRIKISEIAERTGYSERYVNRVFIEQMGFPPKVFCSIIRFQKALEYLNYSEPSSMTQAAADLGYYDQSHFNREFSKYAGMTPKKYLELVKSTDYKNKIRSSSQSTWS